MMNRAKEHPITMDPMMVKALMDGRKTQARIPIKEGWKHNRNREGRSYWTTKWATVHDNGIWHTWDKNGAGGENDKTMSIHLSKEEALRSALNQGFLKCPFGEVGDTLWVREHHAIWEQEPWIEGGVTITPPERGVYYAGDGTSLHLVGTWKDPIKMPRWASRLQLRLNRISIENLHDITEVDAVAEGTIQDTVNYVVGDARLIFEGLWETVKGNGRWAMNPLVWKLEFERIQ